jgi:hypothetical protein
MRSQLPPTYSHHQFGRPRESEQRVPGKRRGHGSRTLQTGELVTPWELSLGTVLGLNGPTCPSTPVGWGTFPPT